MSPGGDGDGSIVLLCNGADNVQTKPGTIWLMRDKGIEQCFEVFVRNAGTVVSYMNRDV